MEEFRKKVIAAAKDAVKRAPNCNSEQSVNMFLILPFIDLLGYNTKDPEEVCPEHHADFSEKYKNRVDFAILRNATPVIAIESKQVGAQLKDDRGQLRSYFNACKTIKMGVLSDGLVYEFYADSDEPNMMDGSAFLTVDFSKIAAGHIEESVIETLFTLQKMTFDPENIGAEAKRKHIFRNILAQLHSLAEEPTEPFTRMMLGQAGLTHLRKNVIDEHTPTIKEAFREFINQHILNRLAIKAPGHDQAEKSPVVPVEPVAESKVETTELELSLVSYVRQKLAFLVKDERLFDEIENIDFKDYQGKFVVFHRMERKGRMFNFYEPSKKDGAMRFEFTDGPEMECTSFNEIDGPLLEIFTKRAMSEIAEDA